MDTTPDHSPLVLQRAPPRENIFQRLANPLFLVVYAFVPSVIAVVLGSFVLTGRYLVGHWFSMDSGRKAWELHLPIYKSIVDAALIAGVVTLLLYPFMLIVWSHASDRLRVVTQGLFALGLLPLLVLLYRFWSWYA